MKYDALIDFLMRQRAGVTKLVPVWLYQLVYTGIVLVFCSLTFPFELLFLLLEREMKGRDVCFDLLLKSVGQKPFKM